MGSQKKAAKGTELRDRSWSIISRSVLDLPPRFITDMTPGGKPVDNTAINGLIRTQKGYYRLAEDTRDGTRVLLHSYERDQLVGVQERDRDGTVRIKSTSNDQYHLYGVSARKDTSGGIFRDDLNHDMRYLERSFQKDLNLHVQTVTAPGKNGRQHQIVKMANGRGAFGIFEGEKGDWKVRYYRNLRKGSDPAERFTTIEESKAGGFFSKLFSMGRDVQTFKTYPEALKYVRQEWNKMSLQIYRGKPVENESPSLRVKLLAKALDFLEERKYRDWIVATVVGVGTALLTQHNVDVSWLSTLGGGTAGAAWVVGGHAVENFIYDKWIKHAALKDNKKMEHLKPYFEQNDIERYLIQTPENEARFRRKIDPKVIPYLRLLDHEEAGMNYDAGEFTPNANPQRPIEDLSSIAYRQFGAMFDSSQAERGLLATLYPTGLVAITQVDPKTHATRHYLTMRQDFNEMAYLNNPHKVDVGIRNLPNPNAAVHKITHKQGRSFGYAALTPEQFMADLMHKVGPDARNMSFFGMKLTDLFKVSGADKLRPQTTDSMTMDEIRAGKTVVEPAKKVAKPAPAGDPTAFVAPTINVPGMG